RFSLQANEGQILLFSSVGYETQDVLVVDRKQIVVQLVPKIAKLDEVIVVGYGTQKKSDLTGSIASVDNKTLHNTVGSNVGTLLAGKVPGLAIAKSNGNSSPGSNPTLRVRGARSLSASNDPLVVVNGIPFNGSINNINPDDITSIQILKDASSTAIYGSRAANGVLLITTRKGSNQDLKVNYSGYAGFSNPFGKYDMMNGNEFIQLKKWAKLNGSPDGSYTGFDDPKLLKDAFTDQTEYQGYLNGANTDWQDLIYKTSLLTNHAISLTGGNAKTQFASSLGYYRETGVYPGQSYSRVSFSLALDFNISKIFKAGINSINVYSIGKGQNQNPMSQALQASPFFIPYDSTGNLNGFLGNNQQVYNALADFQKGAIVDNAKRLSTFTTAYLEATLSPYLQYRLNAGVQIEPLTQGRFYASKTTQRLGGLSAGYNNNDNGYNYTLENIVTYDRTFSGKHHINFTGLFSIQENEDQTTQESYNSLIADYIQYYNPQYATNLTSSGGYAKWDIISYMGRLNYGYKGKYLLTATVRSDGSSVLAPGNKYHLFPSVALGWNINQEDFMKNVTAISNLKLRASYGRVGNAAINPYSTIGSLNTTYYNYGSTNVLGVYPASIPNPNLTWEYTTTQNFGLDYGLLDNRVSGTLEYYIQNTDNLLLNQSLPPTSGIASSFLANVGKTQNKGLELTVNTVNFDGDGDKHFRWTTNLNIYLNRNKIKALASGATSDPSNGWFVGKSSNSIYDYKKVGIWQNTPGDSAAARSLGLTVTGTNSVIGTVRVEDINHDGKITADDRTIIGNGQANFQGGITNEFAYKQFDLSVVATFRQGGLLSSNMFSGWMDTFSGIFNNLNVPYWTPENHENFWPKPNAALQFTPYNSTLTYFNASYLKISSIALGYTIPRSTMKKWKMSSMRVYAQASNPFVLFSPYVNKYHGLDPETNDSLNLNTPPSWSMLFGVNVTF
uniref:SusC/RagA family TonB-linked outer membrane protein n=1 Tax=Sphingobacterium siyangense TaxID=459529 RepID=UPI002FDCCEF6